MSSTYNSGFSQSSLDESANQDASSASNEVVTVVIIALIVVIIKVTIICYCIKHFRVTTQKDLITTVRTEVQAFKAPQVNASPNPELAQIWGTNDAPTMELFIQNLAKQKQVRFTAQQLWSFTNNYAEQLGSGGFGVVYKGQLPNGLNIAVKVLKKSSNKQVEEQFMAEVGTIGKTYHINLVKLYGFCFDHWMSALVYEYMENGSLDKYLFGNVDKLEFDQLHDIAIGTARGLAYLHEECEQRIIHYDIKPGNVLLDSKFSPKVADFGLAKLSNRDDTHVTISGYRGTPGYSAPEFMLKNFPITHKCDVYSFGMLLFEILGQRKNTNHDNRGNTTSSLDWFPKKVWDKHEKDELDEMTTLDCGIEEENMEKAKRMAWIALWCVQDSPDGRPPMSAIVRMLEGGVELTPPFKPFSFLYPPESNGFNQPSGRESDFTSTGGSNYSSWYKESTPIMRRHEIEFASK